MSAKGLALKEEGSFEAPGIKSKNRLKIVPSFLNTTSFSMSETFEVSHSATMY